MVTEFEPLHPHCYIDNKSLDDIQGIQWANKDALTMSSTNKLAPGPECSSGFIVWEAGQYGH